MRSARFLLYFAATAALIGAALPDEARAQAPKTHLVGEVRTVSKSGETHGVSRGSRSRRRVAAPRDSKALRIEVSVADRRLWAIMGSDTLLAAPAAIAEGSTFRYGGRTWKFETPSGVHTVLRKETDPVWRPPMWHYAE